MTSSHEWNHKSDGKFFSEKAKKSQSFRKGEEVAIERHCNGVPVDKDKHTRVFELKKHQTNLSSYKFYKLYEAQSLH